MKSYIRHLDHNPHYTCMGRAILDDHVSLGIFGGLEFVEEYSYVYIYIYISISSKYRCGKTMETTILLN